MGPADGVVAQIELGELLSARRMKIIIMVLINRQVVGRKPSERLRWAQGRDGARHTAASQRQVTRTAAEPIQDG